MGADEPDSDQARSSFQAYVADAVLIAHNAPFDMGFLNRETGPDKPKFDNPVMDTVHLSAIIFGGSALHTLDGLCDRLQINIPDQLRHTASGDALATAEAFVAMLPILEARGLQTFGAVRAAAMQHRRILDVHA
jgi:DNA polymerase-3 subunit epsilon